MNGISPYTGLFLSGTNGAINQATVQQVVIIDSSTAIKSLATNTILKGEITQKNTDGSSVIRTPRGEITVQLKQDLPTGTKLDIQIPSNTSPQKEALIQPRLTNAIQNTQSGGEAKATNQQQQNTTNTPLSSQPVSSQTTQQTITTNTSTITDVKQLQATVTQATQTTTNTQPTLIIGQAVRITPLPVAQQNFQALQTFAKQPQNPKTTIIQSNLTKPISTIVPTLKNIAQSNSQQNIPNITSQTTAPQPTQQTVISTKNQITTITPQQTLPITTITSPQLATTIQTNKITINNTQQAPQVTLSAPQSTKVTTNQPTPISIQTLQVKNTSSLTTPSQQTITPTNQPIATTQPQTITTQAQTQPLPVTTDAQIRNITPQQILLRPTPQTTAQPTQQSVQTKTKIQTPITNTQPQSVTTQPTFAGQITATVTGYITDDGNPIIQTITSPNQQPQLATLNYPAKNLTAGTTITFTPLPTTTNIQNQTSSPWPKLNQFLQNTDNFFTPQMMAQNILNTIPTPSQTRHFPAAALLFLAAAKGGDLSGWLGQKPLKAMEQSAPQLAKQLLNNLTQEIASQTAKSPSPTDPPMVQNAPEWRGHTLPLLFGTNLHHATFWTKDHDRENNQNNDRDTGTRFVVDLNLSRMGDIYFDGYIKTEKKLFDLAIVTERSLSQPMQNMIKSIWYKTLEGLGLDGQLSFKEK